MSISITPLGVNGAFTQRGLQTNYLIEFGSRHLLVDCGTTVARGLHEIEKDLVDIDTVYISHLHLDHIGGLYELGIKRYLAERPRPALYLHNSIATRIWTNFLSSMLDPFLDLEGRPRPGGIETFFDVHPIDSTIESDSFATDVRGLAIRLMPVTHVKGMSCHGLVIDDRIYVTTDTRFEPEKLDLIVNKFNVEAIFHDCSFVPTMHVLHSTYDELSTLPEDLRQILQCTHYEDWGTTDGKETKLALAEAGKKYRY